MNSTTCKFFNSPRGCRSGDECPYIHRWPATTMMREAGEKKMRRRKHTKKMQKRKRRAGGEDEKEEQKKEKEVWVARTKPVPALPNEMWDKIISHCDAGSIAAVCGVCRSMRRTALPRCTSFRVQAAKIPHEEILETLQHIKQNFPHLASLSLVNGHLRGFSFADATLFPDGLLHLSLENSEGLEDDQVKTLAAELPRLRHLDLSNCMELSNQILRYLPTTLTILNLCGVHDINANGLRLLTHLKNLEILDLQACWRLGSLYSQQNPFTPSGPYYSYFPSYPSIATYSAFACLQSLPRLHTLSLSRIYCLADNDIAVLPRRLRVLDISFCFHISDHGVHLLPSALTDLYCQGCDLITIDRHEKEKPPMVTEASPDEVSLVYDRSERGWCYDQSGEGDGEDESRGLSTILPTLVPVLESTREATCGSMGRSPSSGNVRGSGRRKARSKARIIRGEWSLPERCCVP